MKKPIIGIMGSSFKRNGTGGDTPVAFVNESYLKAIILNGGIPFIIPVQGNREDVSQLVELCGGLLFPGGGDVDPYIYGEEVHVLCGPVKKHEDELWIEAERLAEKKRIPVLGICKGKQLVNVSRGGSLYQDLSEFDSKLILHRQQQGRDYLSHKVSISQDSLLSKILGTSHIYTNSMHHQCVKRIAADLKITASTSDSIPEAMESNDGRIVLVQWHPEELLTSEPRMNKLFGWLVNKAMAKME